VDVLYAVKNVQSSLRGFQFFPSEERPSGGDGGGVYGADRPNASDPPP